MLVARDCDFTAPFAWDDRLAAKPGPETASNRPEAIATARNLVIVIFDSNADLLARGFIGHCQDLRLRICGVAERMDGLVSDCIAWQVSPADFISAGTPR